MVSENKARKMILNQSYTKDIKDYIKKAKGYVNEGDRQRFINNEPVMFFFRSNTGVDRFQVKLTQDLKTLRYLEETTTGFYDKYSFSVDELFPNKEAKAKEETTTSTTSTTTKKEVKATKETTNTTTKKVVKRAPRKKATKTTQSSK